MDIPAVFASENRGSLVSGPGKFRGHIPFFTGDTVPFADAVSRIRPPQRMPMVVVDVDSLSRRRFTEGVLKGMRVRGSDIWFMTQIETADDVFDAFNTTAEVVLAPYHTILSKADIADILDVSDSVIPAVFVSNGSAVTRSGPGDVRSIVDDLSGIGYYKMCIVDTDSSVSEYTWSTLADRYPSTVPFVFSNRCDGFGSRIVPFDPLTGRE